MHKNAIFFEKFWKIAAALGAPPPNPRCPKRWGLRVPSVGDSYYLSHLFSRRRM